MYYDIYVTILYVREKGDNRLSHDNETKKKLGNFAAVTKNKCTGKGDNRFGHDKKKKKKMETLCCRH